MRKIETAIIKAVNEKKTIKLSNRDYVEHNNGLSKVYLHGNTIAVYNHEQKTLAFTFAGWDTVTTKSRINAILSVFAPATYYCYHKNYQLYCGGSKLLSSSWYTFCDELAEIR